MADDKKKAAPAAGGALFNKDHYKEVFYIVLPALFLISLLINRLLNFFDNLKYSVASSFWGELFHSLTNFWSVWKWFAVALSLFAFAICVYSFFKLREIEEEEEKIFGHSPEDIFLNEDVAKGNENEKWVKIMAHAHSENPAEWRLAIIEADIMLDELLNDLEYQGEGVGEKLKSVDPTDMLTLDKAWEAHKIRNRIAHSGQDFELSERETKRVIKLFEEVFREFGVI